MQLMKKEEIRSLIEELAHELTEELAYQFVESLVREIDGDSDWIKSGRELYYRVGRELYGPLLAECIQWVWRRRQEIGNLPVFIVLRDAEPLAVAARNLGLDFTTLYLNRPLFGVFDEIADGNEIEMGKRSASLLPRYLTQIGLLKHDKLILLDSGCWGTVVKVLKEKYMQNKKLYPFFWYSHNLYIPGFLNQLAAGRIPDKILETINDSLECVFPKRVKRPVTLIGDKNITKLMLEPTSTLSQTWGAAALRGVADAARNYSRENRINALETLEHLRKLSQEAKQTGNFTGVLPKNTPTWSKGTDFLADWPKDFLP